MPDQIAKALVQLSFKNLQASHGNQSLLKRLGVFFTIIILI